MKAITDLSHQEKYVRSHLRHQRMIRMARFLILITFLALWETSTRMGYVDSFFFSSPSQVALCFIGMVKDLSFFTHTGITLLELNTEHVPAEPQAARTGTVISLEKYRKENHVPETPAENLYARPVYTDTQLQEIQDKCDLSFVLNAVEVYLERLLERADIDFIAWLSDKLSFSSDLILHLYEYCIGKNKKKREYIEKVAISWHQEGIDSVAKAREYSLLFDTCFNAVNKVFSLSRMPIGPERDFIRKWSSWKLPTELIEEACNRTILNICKPDFKYTDRILESWHKAGVSSLAEVKALDATHALMNPKGSADSGNTRPAAPMTKSAGSYNSYPQRQYSSEELSDLESKLLKQM